MCSPARCATCGKTTWSGCGMHADAVLARVPEQQRCACSSAPTRPAQWYPRSPYNTAR